MKDNFVMKFILASFAVAYIVICVCAFIPFLQGVTQLSILFAAVEACLLLYMLARRKSSNA